MFRTSDNFDQFQRGLSDLGQRQLPFALAMALNDTAADVAVTEERNIKRSFDRPTPFTQKAIYRTRASKSRPVAEVGVKRRQAEYLGLQVTGGTRRPKGRALVVPTGIRLNRYGNMPKTAVSRLLAREDTVVVRKGDRKTKHLRPGIYKRKRRTKRGGGGLQMQVAFEGRAHYSKRFEFQAPAMKTARAVMPRHLVKRLKAAIETAK